MPKSFIPIAILLLLGLLGGCIHDSWSYKAVPNIVVARQETFVTQGPLMLKMEPVQTTQPVVATRQTILVASWKHDSGSYRSSVGQTLVIMLDGPPKLGKYWLTPDNSVLITYSAYSSPIRDRINLAGSIEIEKVEANDIVAKLAVKQNEDVDSTGYLDRPYDPAFQQWPFVLTGARTFVITTPDDPAWDTSIVKWINDQAK